MQSKDLDRLQELIRVASRLSVAARPSYLTHAEPQREDLRREALSLLRHDEGRGELNVGELGEPRSVGPYRLLDRWAEAPPARLFQASLASDPNSKALVLVAGPGTMAEGIAADLEAQVRSQQGLREPGLVRLVDAGCTPDKRVFSTFQAMDGAPHSEFVDSLRLPIHDRVALIEALSRAVGSAHHLGIAPIGPMPWSVIGTWRGDQPELSLLLLDPWALLALLAPEARVSKVVLDSLETSAPEALRGEARGVTTDVYALGALLFESVTGTPPLGLRHLAGTRSLREALRKAAHSSPPRASDRVQDLGVRAEKIAFLRGTRLPHLLRELRGGLDAILAKALARDPAARHSSVANLVDELTTWRAESTRSLPRLFRSLVRRATPTPAELDVEGPQETEEL